MQAGASLCRGCRAGPRRAGPRPGIRRCPRGPPGRSSGSFWKVTRCLDGGPQRCEQGFPRLGEPATDDQGAGVQQGERGDQPVGEGVDRVLPDLVRRAGRPESTALAQSAASASGSPLAAAQARVTAAAEARVSRQPRWPQPQSGPPGRTTMWPISPAYPWAPASIAPPMPMAPGDPGAERDEQEPVGAPARADAAFGESAGAYVVAEGDGDAAEPLAEQSAHGDVAPAEVRRVDGDALLGVDDARYGDPGGRGALAEVLLAVRAQLGGEVRGWSRRRRRDRAPGRWRGVPRTAVSRPPRRGRPSSRCRPHRGR